MNRVWTRGVLAIVAVAAVAALFWTKLIPAPGFSEIASHIQSPTRSEQLTESEIQSVSLSEKQAASIKVGPVQTRDF